MKYLWIPIVISLFISCIAGFGVYEIYEYAVTCIPLNEWFKLLQIVISVIFLVGGLVIMYNTFIMSLSLIIFFFT